MAKNLLIVESPAKAKTIEKFLGEAFEVVSSYGHIRDLEKEGMGIDIENDFAPSYKVSDDKKQIVEQLKKKAGKSKEVWLATDEDREGEAISWHLCEVLGLNPKNTKRIVFHEITKKAIQNAVDQPRTVDIDLVDAQQARRVVDRLVGFEISPILWRKLSGAKALSAGRVQSVAVKLLVEREREILDFLPTSDYKIEALFTSEDHSGKQVQFKAEGKRKSNKKAAAEFLEQCINAKFKVADINTKLGTQSPSAPFTTSTLQQEASRKLGYSVSRTMKVAQNLYENGYITYMRTDSVNLSETALMQSKDAIINLHGTKYHKRRVYKTKSQSAQEAHEAIRPTDMMLQHINKSDVQKLYELIWKRTIASQMADAELERTTANIDILKNNKKLDDHLAAHGEVIKFDGFLKVYLESKDDDEQSEMGSLLPKLTVGQELPLIQLSATEKFSKPSPRFTEASLVKKLEELGIGRPSTYAPTISTIQNRGYVEKGNREGVERQYHVMTLINDTIRDKTLVEIAGREKNKLFPSDLGMVVTDFLNDHFTKVMDYGFTAKIEDEFDEIAQGKKAWRKVVEKFYNPFHEIVEDVMENAEKVKGERILGVDPTTGKNVVARLGRFGPMIQIGEADDEEKPKFASIRHNQSIATITLQEALDLFKLPYDLATYKDAVMSVGIGRYGPYIKWQDTFVSIPKDEDPLSITRDRAITLLEKKLEEDKPVAEYNGQPVVKGKGRFGPYLKMGNLYVNVPAKYDFENLSKDQIMELIEAKIEKEANRYIHNWPEEKISVQNGRFGPFIKYLKHNVKLIDIQTGKKLDKDAAKELTLEDVKKIIEKELPEGFKTKSKTTTKKTTRKSTTKKTSTKNANTSNATKKK